MSRDNIDAIIKHIEDEVGELKILNANVSAGTAEPALYSGKDCEVIDGQDSSVTVVPPRKKQRIHPLKKMIKEKFGGNCSEVTSTTHIVNRLVPKLHNTGLSPKLN